MTTTKLLLTAWDFDPSVCIGCALAIAVYFWKVKAGPWRRISFPVGIAVMFVALESPIDACRLCFCWVLHRIRHENG
jgi:multisubunit Na+/H+ antiporter MnhG subunit